MKLFLTAAALVITLTTAFPQPQELIPNIINRNKISLDGKWHIIIDPYEVGYYDYRYKPKRDGYFENRHPKDKSDLVEYDFDKSETLEVPGDWNTQKKELLLYEGTIWYKKSFNYKIKPGIRTFLYFGAANYDAIVYLNGKKLGEHIGGFTPFNFETTNYIKDGNNFVVVKVDDKRLKEGVPTLDTDWWNYGGLTRDVYLVEEPNTFIQDYFIQLQKGSLNVIGGWIKLNGNYKNQNMAIQIPGANVNYKFSTNENGTAKINFNAKLKLWSPDDPYLYNVRIISETDTVEDQIGFRSIEVNGTELLLNDKPVFLHGVSMHEEAPFRSGRIYSVPDDRTLLTWAKELNCNYVRLAHYPYNENMIREAEKMGILVWSEIPVYWTIQWENKNTLDNALNQLTENITRDKNRASVVIWSMANETPRSDERLNFLKALVDSTRILDPTRLITAATETRYDKNQIIVDDPLCEYLDIIGVNEYIGWYLGKPEDALNKVWINNFNKPLIISELGGGALYGYHGDKDTRWTEEFQADVYKYQIEMLKKISFLRGVSPWILMDFRSPRRPLPYIQDFFNRKGLISNRGEKKEAFYILANFYSSLKSKK